MSDIDYDKLGSTIARENGKLLQGLAKTSSAGGGGGFDFSKLGLGKFTGATDSAAGALVKLWSGTTTATDGLNLFTKVIDKIPGIGGALSSLTGQFGNAVLQTNANLNESARNGANFNNNLVEYDRLVKGARLTQDEYNGIVKNNSVALNGLGSTVNRSQGNLLQFTKELQESPVGRQLQDMGMSAEEIAAFGVANLANTRGLNLADKDARKQAVDSTLQMAYQMEETARITGKSREQQQADIKARGENVVVQAAVMQMGADGMQKYKEMQTKMEGMGKGVQDVADELFTGGIRTKEGAAKFAALGPAGAELEKAVLASKNAKTKEDKDRADEQMIKAKAAINDYQRSKEYLDMVQYGTGAASESARTMMKDNVEAASLAAKREEEKAKGGPEKSTAELQKGQRQEVARNMQGQDAEGRVAKGTEVGRAINTTDRALKDVAAGASVGFGKLVEKTNDLVGGFGNLAGKLPPLTQDQAAAVPGKLIDKVGETIKTGLGSLPKTEPKAAENKSSTANHPLGEIRDTGTLGMTGQLFEPKDFHGKVAKGETVLTPDQLKNLVNGASASAAPDFDSLFNNFTTQFNNSAKQESAPDMASMVSDVSKQLGQSPISGGMPDVQSMFSSIMPSFDSLKTSLVAPEPAKPPKETASTDKPKVEMRPAGGIDNITLKDLHEDLVQLNKMMGQLVSTSSDSVDATHKVARATKNAGNRLLPA